MVFDLKVDSEGRLSSISAKSPQIRSETISEVVGDRIKVISRGITEWFSLKPGTQLYIDLFP
ncbi:hypothetical protein ACFL7D_11665, partial [candidate division KSB1 bacterium]